MVIKREINGRLVTATCWVLLSMTRGGCGALVPRCGHLLGAGNHQAGQHWSLPRGAVPGPWAALRAMEQPGAAPGAEPPVGTIHVGFFPPKPARGPSPWRML